MRLESAATPFHRPGLDDIVQLYDKRKKLIYPRFTRSIENRSAYFRAATEGDFPIAQPIERGDNIPLMDFATPFYKDHNYTKYGLGFEWDLDASSSDKYGLFSRRGPKMVDATRRAMEIDMAGFVSLATATTNEYLTPDGLPLASASHLLANGTDSNILTGNPALSVTSLAQAIQALMRQKSHEGDYMGFTGPYILLVPPELADLAYRLTGPGRQPTTNNNEQGWVNTIVSEVVVNPYFTSPTAWALVVAEKSRNPLVMVNRRGLVTRTQELQIHNDTAMATVTAIWVRASLDWRGFIYSGGI
ncbi:hypothetical protein EON81_25390 [bacterium]|nr:MAG: hypothetical protein EON81_25390 [bacterium]